MLGTRGSHLAKKWKFYLNNISMKFLDKCDREIRLYILANFISLHTLFPTTFLNLNFSSFLSLLCDRVEVHQSSNIVLFFCCESLYIVSLWRKSFFTRAWLSYKIFSILINISFEGPEMAKS